MYSQTDKVGSMGRYGPRIGKKIRDRIRDVEDNLKKSKNCPFCKKPKLKKIFVGVWECKACGMKFTGGAFAPKSAAKSVVKEEEISTENV